MIGLLALALAAAPVHLSGGDSRRSSCSTPRYLALRCGGEGDAMEKDVCTERGSKKAVEQCVRRHRAAQVRKSAKEDDEFICDDHPWRSRGCGLSPRERRLARRADPAPKPEKKP